MTREWKGAIEGFLSVYGVVGIIATFMAIAYVLGFGSPSVPTCKLSFQNGQIVMDKLTRKHFIISSASCAWTLVRDENNNRFFVGSAEFVQ